MMASLPMTVDEESGLFTIPISFNAVEKQFLFDTGGAVMQVSSKIVEQLKLPQHQSPVELYGVDGKVSRMYTTVKDITIGNMRGSSLDMQVSSDDMDGSFAPLGWRTFDFDLDFGNRKLNMFSSDHCDGKVVYWSAKALAVVPVDLDNDHVTVPVTVDGRNLKAIIDTGASSSTMRLDIAHRVFNLAPDSPDMKAVGNIGDDKNAVIYEHAFKTLTFEGVTVTNPHIAILTDVVNKNADHRNETGSLIRKNSDDLVLPEVIVGMDVLRKLHLYLAIKEKRLYLTEASASPGP